MTSPALIFHLQMQDNTAELLACRIQVASWQALSATALTMWLADRAQTTRAVGDNVQPDKFWLQASHLVMNSSSEPTSVNSEANSMKVVTWWGPGLPFSLSLTLLRASSSASAAGPSFTFLMATGSKPVWTHPPSELLGDPSPTHLSALHTTDH